MQDSDHQTTLQDDAAAMGQSASAHAPVAKNLILLHLPVEMILIIAEHLSLPDLAAMALTCKDMDAALGSIREVRRFTYRERLDFLYRLERDLGSTHLFCSFCGVLHQFHKDPMEQTFWEIASRGCAEPGFLPMLRWTGYTRGLGYNTARLLANNHRLGPGHGFDVDDVFPDNRVTSILPPEGLAPPRWHVRVEGKFVSGDLMVKATHRLRGELSHPMLKMESVTRHPLCHHYVAEHFLEDVFAPDAQATYARNVAVLLRGMIKGCRRCETDWYFAVSRGGDDVAVAVTTYHRFGDISSHEENAWGYMTGGFPMHGRAALKHRRYERGTVAAAWEAAPSRAFDAMQPWRESV